MAKSEPMGIADGEDVAQGSTNDAAGANTVIGQLKQAVAKLTGTLTADVTDRAARLLGHVTVDNASIPVTGTFWQGAQPVTDNAGSLTVDAPVGTPVWVRLSDGAAAYVGQKTLANSLPVAIASDQGALDISDRAARLLGVVDKGKIWDGTNIAAVKAASALAAAADPALAVQHSPQRADASNLAVTATGAAAAAVTLTLPAPAAGLFHYITSIQIVKFATALLTAGAVPVLVTTTNLPGSPVFSFSAAASAAGTDEVQQITPTTPIKSSAAATATTIVGPATTATIWRINVTYYTAP